MKQNIISVFMDIRNQPNYTFKVQTRHSFTLWAAKKHNYFSEND